MALCPSAPCEEGALLIGRALQTDKVVLLSQPIPVSSTFVAEAVKHRSPEKRFRFASPCKGGACANWNGQSCGVPDQVKHLTPTPMHTTKPPECGIRVDCRWYQQEGVQACFFCVSVTTQRDI